MPIPESLAVATVAGGNATTVEPVSPLKGRLKQTRVAYDGDARAKTPFQQTLSAALMDCDILSIPLYFPICCMNSLDYGVLIH